MTNALEYTIIYSETKDGDHEVTSAVMQGKIQVNTKQVVWEPIGSESR